MGFDLDPNHMHCPDPESSTTATEDGAMITFDAMMVSPDSPARKKSLVQSSLPEAALMWPPASFDFLGALAVITDVPAAITNVPAAEKLPRMDAKLETTLFVYDASPPPAQPPSLAVGMPGTLAALAARASVQPTAMQSSSYP